MEAVIPGRPVQARTNSIYLATAHVLMPLSQTDGPSALAGPDDSIVTTSGAVLSFPCCGWHHSCAQQSFLRLLDTGTSLNSECMNHEPDTINPQPYC